MKKEKGYLIAGKIGSCILMLALALFALSCATKSEAYKLVDAAVEDGDFARAVEVIVEKQTPDEKGKVKDAIYPEKNTIMLYLDKGFLEHYAGNYSQSSQDLQEAERLIEEAFTKSVSADIASYVANDNTKDYAGEDFEDIYLNVFNALNYYKQGNNDGAMVEIRKLTNSSGKLDMLARKYEGGGKSAGEWVMEQLGKVGFKLTESLPQGKSINFSNSALARYLAAIFYLKDGNRDGARIEFDQLEAAFASNSTIYYNPVPNSVAQDRNIPAGMGRVSVLAFAGLSPVKEEGLFTQHWGFMTMPDLQQPVFKLPVFIERDPFHGRDKETKRHANTHDIEVTVGGETFKLQLLEDMGAVVHEVFNAKFANMFLKTYIRVLLKYAVVEVAAQQGGGGMEMMLMAKVAKKALDATEGADIRMGRYLPNSAYIGGVNLAPGNYDVTVKFKSGTEVKSNIEVKAGTSTLVDAFCLRQN